MDERKKEKLKTIYQKVRTIEDLLINQKGICESINDVAFLSKKGNTNESQASQED